MCETTAVGAEPVAVIDEAAAIVEAEWMRLMSDEGSGGSAADGRAELPAAQTERPRLGALTTLLRECGQGGPFGPRCLPTRQCPTDVWATQRSPPALI